MKNISPEIGKRLREARLRRKLTQQQVADATGVTRQMVSRWEKGDPLPAAEHWYKLGLLLGTSIDLIVYGPVVSKIFRNEGAAGPAVAPVPELEVRPA